LSLLRTIDLRLAYGRTVALDGVNLTLDAGEVVAVLGPSGSGKSSMLYCLSGVLKPDSGEVWFRDHRIDNQSADERSRLRLRVFGFVMQLGLLVPELSLLENVALPLRLIGQKKSHANDQAIEWLDRLGIGSLAGRRPGEVSGGEMQRAAVARALVHSPGIVYCDEPTGSLDTENGKIVLDLLVAQARDLRAATMIVTHNEDLTTLADRVLRMADGRVVEG
jgi:putative ABC transport system ATP-binding protein